MMFTFKKFRAFCRDKTAASAIIFSLLLPVLVAGAGVAVDLGQAYNVKNRLGNALDKAALAVASSSGTEEELTARMYAFLEANYPAAKIGTPYDIDLVLNENLISITAHANVETSFMRVFGHDEMNVGAFTEVTRELAGIEVAMVLDVTGSMAGTNIIALRTASTDFINIMFDRISDPEFVKIGIVPYSTSVNVGPYGWGEDEVGGEYDTPFVVTPEDDDHVADPSTIVYDTDQTLQWHGCVLAKDYPDDTDDTPPGDWVMYRFPEVCTSWRWGSCRNWLRQPNYICPQASVQPLTNNQDALLNKIASLEADGWTMGNYGMVWGWRLISPGRPFAEGAPYDDENWQKAVLMMTDGANTVHSTYTAYGDTDGSITSYDLNERFEEVCNKMKQAGIQIYTITFQSGVNDDTRDYYRRCATDPSMYFHAPSNAALVEAFNDIANQLSQLHISQ